MTEEELGVEDYVEQIQPEIAYCYNCQPYEGGEPVWVFGDRRDLEDLLDEYEVPESLRDEVANKLVCDNCGTQMQRGAEIGLKPEEEKGYDRKLEEWREHYEDKFVAFAAFLESYPYLGVLHPLGQTIVDNMKEFPKIRILDKDWYRAKRIKDGKKVLTKDLIAPDPTKVQIPEGRFNHFGQSHWYLASSEMAGAKETLEKDESMVWIQKVHIMEAADILDVRGWGYGVDEKVPVIAFGLIFTGALEKPIERDKNWKPEYFIPRFIADSAKLAGFKGIIYKSDRHYDDNLVLFEPSSVRYEFKDEPYIFEMRKDTILGH